MGKPAADTQGSGRAKQIRRRLTLAIVNQLPARASPYRVWDVEVPQLHVRVQPSGIKTYNVQWSRTSTVALSHKHPALLPDAARTQARAILNDSAKNGVPQAAKKTPVAATLRKFLDESLEPWASANRKWGTASVKRIKAAFADYLDKPISALNAWVIEKWRSQRLKSGIADATVNRELAALKSALARAVEWHLITEHPLSSVKLRRVDNARVRFLDTAEEGRLRKALAGRDAAIASSRNSGNKWRKARGVELLPKIKTGDFADHITPMVLLAMNTGLRRGELFSLTWEDIALPDKRLHVRAAAAKSGMARHLPLNAEAMGVLNRWRKQRPGPGRLFPVSDVKSAWGAVVQTSELENFHFHDLRHTFASRLVSAGVDLNTVRELLGHADLKMTLRYAHLAKGHKEAAVELLGRQRGKS